MNTLKTIGRGFGIIASACAAGAIIYGLTTAIFWLLGPMLFLWLLALVVVVLLSYAIGELTG